MRELHLRLESPDDGREKRLMRWTTMLAHLFWAAAAAITCAIEPAVPLGLAAIGALLVAWMTGGSEDG